MYTPYVPRQIYVTADAANYPHTRAVLERLPSLEPITIPDITSLSRYDSTQSFVLARQKGGFFKPCPCTQKYVCCGYKILNLVNNCELNCSYCVLQGYLNNPHIIAYVNLEDLFDELDTLFETYPNRLFRIGTGELADSLSTDHLTGFSSALVAYFADKSNAIIELKTKTSQIDNFIGIEHRGRTVVSWSMNTPRLIASDESMATTLNERLAAAKKCADAGFRIGFHFDPMIHYDGWQDEYKSVVDRIFQTIPAERIIWISLGALRYPPHLDAIIREQHPQSKIVYGELITGLDGKMRYFKSVRAEMFRKMHAWIREYSTNVFVYLCMESAEMYQDVFGWDSRTTISLSRRMNELIL
ncbi:DNA photolyase [candidate division KSB1 bacterium]|nr:DNA photolyase [candidate division KSB1 bacterium]